MKTITLARKPVVGTVANNTLSHGCGGINIDASRIKGLEGEHIGPTSLSTPANRTGVFGTDLLCKGNVSKESFQQAQLDSIERANNLGRFPANLILQHRAGCEQDGVKRVKGSFLNHECTDGDLYGKYASVRKRGHTDKDGKETVTNWICEQGCPVASLDTKSGITKSPKNYVRNADGFNNGGYSDKPMIGQSAGTLSLNHGDAGGTSRFFKQVKP